MAHIAPTFKTLHALPDVVERSALCKLFGVSYKSFQRAERDGEIEGIRLFTNRTYYRRDDAIKLAGDKGWLKL